MNFEEARELTHKLNHGDAKSGVGQADHVNLRDGITLDGVDEDTKIPLTPFNPLDEPDVYDVSIEVPEVGQETVDFWRSHQRRDTKHGYGYPGSILRALRRRDVSIVVREIRRRLRRVKDVIKRLLSLKFPGV